MSTAVPGGDEFFIGWEPAPRGYRRFLRLLSALLLIAAAALAMLMACQQGSPGAGQWDSEEIQSFDGIIFARPYPMLRVPGSPPRTFLLVEEGKFGAQERVEKIIAERKEGRAVRVKGTILHRGGRGMLELAQGDEGMRPLTAEEKRNLPSLTPLAPEVRAEQMTLKGEIIDPKCYLGAMKPGGGKTHKACAALCIAGGIPPMLVTLDADRRETFYLLTTFEGARAGEMVIPFVGDQVEITGRLERQGDILILAASAVRRR